MFFGNMYYYLYFVVCWSLLFLGILITIPIPFAIAIPIPMAIVFTAYGYLTPLVGGLMVVFFLMLAVLVFGWFRYKELDLCFMWNFCFFLLSFGYIFVNINTLIYGYNALFMVTS